MVITRHDKAVAALIPISEDEDLERLLLGYSPRLRAILSAARQRIRSGQGLPHDRFWREAGAVERAKAKR